MIVIRTMTQGLTNGFSHHDGLSSSAVILADAVSDPNTRKNIRDENTMRTVIIASLFEIFIPNPQYKDEDCAILM